MGERGNDDWKHSQFRKDKPKAKEEGTRERGTEITGN